MDLEEVKKANKKGKGKAGTAKAERGYVAKYKAKYMQLQRVRKNCHRPPMY